LYLAASLAIIVVLWPWHGVRGEIFCFSTSSSVVVFVGGGLVLAGIDFVTNDMAGVQRNLVGFFYYSVYVEDVDLAGIDLWSLVYQHVVKSGWFLVLTCFGGSVPLMDDLSSDDLGCLSVFEALDFSM
jgi:hypothetical protein